MLPLISIYYACYACGNSKITGYTIFFPCRHKHIIPVHVIAAHIKYLHNAHVHYTVQQHKQMYLCSQQTQIKSPAHVHSTHKFSYLLVQKASFFLCLSNCPQLTASSIIHVCVHIWVERENRFLYRAILHYLV